MDFSELPCSMIDQNIDSIDPRYCLRIPLPEGRGEQRADTEDEAHKKEEKAVRCAQCGHGITSPRERIDVQGMHQHAFCNPYGIIFEIGCFRAAPGCGYAGPATEEFSWFAGYNWRIAVCSACQTHLGWQYSAAERESFHGLVLDNLIQPD
jgi:hypothetical protein